MSTITTTRDTTPVRRRTVRALAVVAAALAAMVVWALVEVVAGIDVWAPATGAGDAHAIGPGNVAAAAAVASLAGWGLLALLERLTARAAAVWTACAVLALLASLGAPLTGEGISAANRTVLVLLHLTVGTVIVPVLYRTSSRPGARAANEDDAP